MYNGTSGFSVAEVSAMFPRRSRLRNALALSAGVLLPVAVGVVSAPFGHPIATLLAGSATGVYYGVIYMRAVGGPIWNLVLPGLVAAAVLDFPRIPPPGGTLSEWQTPLSAYLIVTLVVALWHRHLGDRQSDWAAHNFPSSYRRLLGVTDT